MTTSVSKSLASQLETSVSHRLVTLWEINRTDGVTLRFTDHSHPLVDLSGETYAPAGGMDASARQKKANLDTRNLDVRGIITSDEITFADLNAGRYRGAQVIERTVDWKYPWAGFHRVAQYTVLDTSFDGETWTATIAGLTHSLRIQVGSYVEKDCEWNLGEAFGLPVAGCKVDLSALIESGTVTAINSSRRVFESDLTSFVDGYFNDGFLTFTSGDNDGLEFEVKSFIQADGVIEFNLKTPYNIQVGDTFTVHPGCDQTPESCKGTTGTKGRPWASQIENYGGFNFVPGTKRILQTPNAK